MLDQNTTKKLRFGLVPHFAVPAAQMGWAKIANGTLIRLAEESGFDVLVTADQNIIYQQNNAIRRVALVVLSTNRWRDLRENLLPIKAAVDASSPGSYIRVEIADPPKLKAAQARLKSESNDVDSDR